VAAPQIDPSWTDDDAPAQTNGVADDDPSAAHAFDRELAGHGNWVDDPTYGRIWVPDKSEVGEGFAPYQSAGHWTLDDDSDWLWASDYDWGYVPFHYGRWLWAPTYGWSWIPGRVYAPAWVSWRVGGGGYIGWAPLAPRFYWRGGRAVAFGRRPAMAYCFAPTGHVFAHDVSAHVARSPADVRAAAASTRTYHGASPARGPSTEQAHVSASAAASAHFNGRTAASVHASGSSAFHGGFGGSSAVRGAYGHGFVGHGGGLYGHSYGGGRTSAAPSRSSGRSSHGSSHTHHGSGGARSSGHASGHHR
jgi:hypothetical protein